MFNIYLYVSRKYKWGEVYDETCLRLHPGSVFSMANVGNAIFACDERAIICLTLRLRLDLQASRWRCDFHLISSFSSVSSLSSHSISRLSLREATKFHANLLMSVIYPSPGMLAVYYDWGAHEKQLVNVFSVYLFKIFPVKHTRGGEGISPYTIPNLPFALLLFQPILPSSKQAPRCDAAPKSFWVWCLAARFPTESREKKGKLG